MDGHTSPLDISSFINVCENEDQEAFIITLSEGGALFLLRHSSILFTSEGSVITAMIFILLLHFGHIRGSTSYTFWISRAQLLLEALDDTVSISEFEVLSGLFSGTALYPKLARLPSLADLPFVLLE